MGCVDTGRWTCPDCNRVLTVHGSEPDCRTAIRAVQIRHARGHAARPVDTINRPKESQA